jgi:hypothetical protein
MPDTSEPIILSDSSLLFALEALRVAWRGVLQVGLFQNDFQPGPRTTIRAVKRCTFSGYVGLRTIAGFNAPTFDGLRGLLSSGQIVWSHNGGPIPNFVFGYYVVDSSGNYLWAARRKGGPAWLASAGQTYPVVPVFSLRSEFGEVS